MNLDSLAQELDRLYEFEISEYIARCNELKQSGYKIYRNSQGQHKVVIAGQGRASSQQQYVNEQVEPKKDNFFVRAKRGIKKTVNGFRSFVGFIKFLYRMYKNNNDVR